MGGGGGGAGVAYLGQGAVVPDVSVVREAVVDEAQHALLHVLPDRIHLLRRADLGREKHRCCTYSRTW